MNEIDEAQLIKYWVLVVAFEQRRLTAAEFETLFLALYKNDPTQWGSSAYEVLQAMFRAIDEFVPSEDSDNQESEDRLRSAIASQAARLRHG